MLVATIIMEMVRSIDEEKKKILKEVCDKVLKLKLQDFDKLSYRRQEAKAELKNNERIASVTNFKFKEKQHIIWMTEWYEEWTHKAEEIQEGKPAQKKIEGNFP